MKPYRFENAPLLKAYSKPPGSQNELDRRRVTKGVTALKLMRLQMKPRPCKQCLKQLSKRFRPERDWNPRTLRCQTLKQTTYEVINLALADLSVGCFGVENLVLSYTKEKPSAIGCLTVDVVSECVSFLSLNVLSLERIHAIFWPLLHRINKTLSYIYIIWHSQLHL